MRMMDKKSRNQIAGVYKPDHLAEILATENPNENEEQRVRQRNARKCVIISIDKDNQTAVFKGSGKKPYTTTLETCMCQDFGMRKLPCKHIYRLAHELGTFDLDSIPDGRVSAPSLPRTPMTQEIKGIIDNLSSESQEELYNLVRLWIASSSSNEWLYHRDNESAIELVASGFLEEFDAPELTMSMLAMQQLREILVPHKIKVKSKKEAVTHILNVAPEIFEQEKKKYWPLRFKEEFLPMRGQIRTYLKPRFPEFYPSKYDPEIFLEGPRISAVMRGK